MSFKTGIYVTAREYPWSVGQAGSDRICATMPTFLFLVENESTKLKIVLVGKKDSLFLSLFLPFFFVHQYGRHICTVPSS